MTSPHAVAALRDALTAGVEKHFEILYYRKDGEFLKSSTALPEINMALLDQLIICLRFALSYEWFLSF